MINTKVTPDALNATAVNMVKHLGIEILEIAADRMVGRMPVDHRTQQPMGLLHGGASVVLAETLGSLASNLCVDMQKQYCVGLEVNANHIKSAKSGYVTGTATPIHLGKRTHVWEIRIVNEANDLVCISRLTMAVMDR
jgi:1,4-dihydroxy-2-naphthoyl-CoA hydrolase